MALQLKVFERITKPDITEVDPHPTSRRTFVGNKDGKPVHKYYPIDFKIIQALKDEGYTINGLIARSNADVFNATKDGIDYAVVMEDESGGKEIYRDLVGKKNEYLAEVYYYKVFGKTSVIVEEKALKTIEDYCHCSQNLEPNEKVGLVRGIFKWTYEANHFLVKMGLVHTDPNIGNIAIFNTTEGRRLKYIDLESLDVYDKRGFVLEPEDMDLLLAILFRSF